MKYNSNNWRVELHVHLDGSYRPSTILKLAKDRGVKLPSSDSPDDFAEFCRMKAPGTLTKFLKKFPIWIQVVAGDKEAITKTAHDFVEDCSRQKIAYVELRFCPKFLATDDLTEGVVLEATIKGIKEAEEKFGTKCNVIVSFIRGLPGSRETFDAARRFFGNGVVGIDIAGDESENDGRFDDDLVKIFQEAEKLGINRTIHAGEVGAAKCVETAVTKLKAQRIGHGYRVVQDESIYQRMHSMNIHFETCPTSSILTGAAEPDWKVHPIRKFHNDKINYSLNVDDTLVIGKDLTQEYDLCRQKLDLDTEEIVRCNFNAAKASFLNKEEKEELLAHMRKVLKNNSEEIESWECEVGDV